VQLTLTADVIGLVVGQLVLGPLSDARGRRRLLIGSTLICALASVLCALAPSAGWLAVWRFLQGASGGGGVVLARDRVFAGYALAVTFAYASLFGYIAGSSFALQEVHGMTASQFSLVFAFNAAGMIGLGLLNARLVRRWPVRSLLLVGLVASTVAAVILVVVVAGAGTLLAVLVPLFLVVASRGLVSANATVLGVKRAPAAGAASAVLGACMFGGGILVSPLAALAVTVLLTRGDHPEPAVDADAAVSAEPIEE
jgi:DHA1 family bicyclomycin/chloramphenicol resistance-like MFS transporter